MNSAKKEQIRKLHDFCKKVINGETSMNPDLTPNSVDFSIILFCQQVGGIITKKEQKKSMPAEYFLDFDIKNNCRFLWDMLFLSKVIMSTTEETSRQELLNELGSKTPKVNIISDTTWLTRLNDQEVKKIKEAIVISQKMRDCFSHEKDKTTIIDNDSQMVKIKSEYENNKINCVIPFQYIQNFGSGIIPLPEHKDIADEINKLISNIFYKLKLEIKETPNFLYTVHPERIKRLLEFTHGNLEIMEKLPSEAFKCDEERLNLILGIEGMTPEILSKLPPEAIINLENTKQILSILSEAVEKNLISNITGNILEILTILPPGVFYTPKNIKRILNIKGMNLEILKSLPEEAFILPNEVEKILKINGMTPDILSKLPSEAFRNSFIVKDILSIEGMTPEILKSLPEEAFVYSTFGTSNRVRELLKNEKIHPRNLPYLPIGAFKYPHVVKKILSFKRMTFDIFMSLPEEAFRNPNAIKEILNIKRKIIGNVWKTTVSPGILKMLPPSAFKHPKKVEKILNIEGMKQKIIEVLPEEAFLFPQNLEKILNIKGMTPELLKVMSPIKLHFNETELMKIINLECITAEIFVSLPNEALMFPERVEKILNIKGMTPELLKSLPSICFSEWKNIKRIISIDGKPMETMRKLTEESFMPIDRLEKILKLEEINSVILKALPDVLFYCEKERFNKIINLEGFTAKDLDALPNEAFYCDDARLNRLLNKVDRNCKEFSNLPRQIFVCQEDLVDQIYDWHKENLVKPIFGIGNEKIIALIAFMNKVFETDYKDIQINNLNLNIFQDMTVSNDVKTKAGAILNYIIDIDNKISEIKELIRLGRDKQWNSGTLLHKLSPKINQTAASIESIKNLNNFINSSFVTSLRNCSYHTLRITESDKDNDKVKIQDYTLEENGNKRINLEAEVELNQLLNLTLAIGNQDDTRTMSDETDTNEIGNKINLIDTNEIEVKKKLLKFCLKIKGMTNITEKRVEDQIIIAYFNPTKGEQEQTIDELWRDYQGKVNIFETVYNEYINIKNYLSIISLKEKFINEINNFKTTTDSNKKAQIIRNLAECFLEIKNTKIDIERILTPEQQSDYNRDYNIFIEQYSYLGQVNINVTNITDRLIAGRSR